MRHPGPIDTVKWRSVLTVWVLIVLGAAGLVAWAGKAWTPPGNPQANRPDQCEALALRPNASSGVILEQQNTWSNAAYLLVGLVILSYSRRPMGLSLGTGLVALAISSGLYHATLQDDSSHSIDARTMDVAAMYFVLWALLGYAVLSSWERRVSRLTEWSLAMVLAVIAYITARYRYHVWLFSSTTAVLLLVAAIALVCFWQMYRHPTQLTRYYLAIFTITGAIAVFFRFTDGDGRLLCKPHAVIQPHSIWHVASAALLLFAYDFFARSRMNATYTMAATAKPTNHA